MNLELLISPSGFGKTSFILEDIEKNRDTSKIIILTPEQNSFNFEKLLCEKFGGTFNIDVMNFSSLTKKFSKTLGVDLLKNLGEDIKPFYFYKAAKKLEDKNNFLANRILQDSSFIDVVQDIIKELKEYQVSINVLEDYLEKDTTLEKVRREKLSAILELYIEYSKLLKESSVYDKQDYINELLLYSKYLDLDEYVFYIDGYYNFTAQEYSYIEKLIQKSKKVAISIIADSNRYFNVDLVQLAVGYEVDKIKYQPFYLVDLHREDKYKLDIFRKSHEVMASVNEIIRRNSDMNIFIMAFVENGKDITQLRLDIKNNEVVSYEVLESYEGRFEGSANKTLATKYYKNFKGTYGVDDSVEVIVAKNKELEIKEIAREILKLKEKNGIKNSDIAILYRDTTYENYENIFRDYNLDIHLDKDIDVSNHRLIKFLELVLNYKKLSFQPVLIDILKTKLTNFEDIYRRKVMRFILGCDMNISEKELPKIYKEKTLEKLLKKADSFDSLMNSTKDVMEYEEFLQSIKALSVESLENILNQKLVASKEILFEGKYIGSGKNEESYELQFSRHILLELIEKIEVISKEGNLKIKRYIKKIEELFDYCNIKMYLDKEDGEYDDIEELKIDSIDRQVYKKTLELLNSIVDKFGDEKLEYDKFVELVLMGLETIKYRSIPEISESIIMSKMDLAKVENKRIVFVAGFNKDVLPISKGSGLLDDNDKENFLVKDVFLSPTTSESLIDEEFVAYIALTRARSKTYISYSLLDKSFKENFPTPYLAVVKNLLPELKERTTSKILEYNLSDYNYYQENMNEILTVKEYNYLFSKIYRRFMEVKNSHTKEVDNLVNLLILFLGNYEGNRENYDNKDYEIYSNLTDRIYFDKNTIAKNYLEKIIRDYKFELSNDNIKAFLEKNGEQFSKFSISKISDYEKNPYLFFIKRVLGIMEERKVDIDNLVMGRFFHAVLADKRVIDFIKTSGEKLDTDLIKDEDIIKKIEIRKLIDEVVFDNKNDDIVETLGFIELLSTHSYILQNMLRRLEIAIAVEIKYYAITKYTPSFLEKQFELIINKNQISCVELESKKIITKKLNVEYNIPTIKFTGFIDRIDVLGKNIAVIDYKSSQTDFSLESLELGFISQILTYSLACEMLLNKKSEDILGIFYREIARLGKNIHTYRLRGLGNKDLILQSDFMENNADVMYIRTTKKGVIHGADDYKTYSSSELEVLIDKNLHNLLKLLEKIYMFDFSLENYEVENQYEAEQQTLFNYSTLSNTRLEYKEKVMLKAKELKEKILNE